MKQRLLIAIGLMIAFVAGMFLGPKKTEVKEVQKVVYKERSNTKLNTKRTTVKKQIKRPDGTIETETTTSTDKSLDKKTNSSLNSERLKEAKQESRPDWRLIVSYFPEVPRYQNQSATIDLQRRILSELYLGVAISTDKRIGLSVSIGF